MIDLLAIRDRDPATEGLLHPFLHFKGFKALQAFRIAHVLWKLNRKDVAKVIQARTSELYAIDIHPAAVIGDGLMMDHGTGIVIGETARVGRNCTFLHGVTLGSTGKDKGDRHPKVKNRRMMSHFGFSLPPVVLFFFLFAVDLCFTLGW
jgi:serine O-acetyltransferase